jgi:hypothetical protein
VPPAGIVACRRTPAIPFLKSATELILLSSVPGSAETGAATSTVASDATRRAFVFIVCSLGGMTFSTSTLSPTGRVSQVCHATVRYTPPVDRIIGQPQAVEQLERALASERVHHAWIFSGPFGVGKCTTAIELARSLLDPEGRLAGRNDPTTHPDLHLIYKELALFSDNPALRSRKLLNIPLDLLRERMIGGKTGDDKYHDAPAYRTPLESRRKVFIIDEAELIDVTAQNALLKTLEEPPADTCIILVTNRPDRLLETIHSRSQTVRFHPLDDDALRTWFERSGLEVSGDERDWIVGFCEGSPGVATVAAEYGFHGWQQRLSPMLAEAWSGRYPATLGPTMAELVDEFAKAWEKNHDNASKDAANKSGARHMFRLLTWDARARLQAACREEADPQAMIDVIDLVAAAEQQLDANVNMKHVFENLATQTVLSAP